MGRLAAGRAESDVRGRLVQYRPATAGPHHRSDLLLRRQCADRDIVLRTAANLARTFAGPGDPVVRAARLQPVLPALRHRLPDGRYPVEGICRAGMVRRSLADRGVGDV